MSVMSSFAGTDERLAQSQWSNSKRQLTPTDNRPVIPWETRCWWSCVRSAPEMVAGIGEEVGFSFVEVRRRATVLLRKDDFVEEFDLRIFARDALTFVDKFVERLGLLQTGQVLHVLRRLVLHEFIHLELVVHARLFAVASGGHEITAVRVQ